MKKRTKIISLSLCSALLAMVLAGCGAEEAESAAGSSEPTSSQMAESTASADQKEAVSEESAKEPATDEAEVRAGTFTADIDMSQYDAKESVRLWVPAAVSDDYQTISNVKVEVAGDNAEVQENTDEFGNDMYYVEWKPEDKERKLTYSFDVERKEVQRPELVEEGEVDVVEFKQYLQPSSLLPIDGEIKATADKIVAGETTVLGKTEAIYDWIYDNMERDNDVIGCGQGDVKQLLVEPRGKCTDISSVFIAMLRSQGIPAREEFGVRLSADPQAEITSSQHCWTEFYLPGTGWVAADPADVLKKVKNEELSKADPAALEAKDYFFGNVDALRVGFSTGRDVILNPAQAGEPLNTFGYPYAEVDGKVIDCYAPEEFVYKINFAEK